MRELEQNPGTAAVPAALGEISLQDAGAPKANALKAGGTPAVPGPASPENAAVPAAPSPGTAGVSPASSPWHSRGYLPHFTQPGLIQSVTFRLHDAIPQSVIDGWRTELNWLEGLPADDPREVELRERIAKYEDQGCGACWLKDARIARLVQDALLHFDGQRYRLIAWCIMPNHVHVLVQPGSAGVPPASHSLDSILHSWKSFTAHEANKVLGRDGKFWFREYYDRFIRNERHYANAKEYIENNPVKAGLVMEKSQWRWSNAFGRE